MLETGKPLLLPTVPGIFVPERLESDLERLLASSRLPSTEFDSSEIVIGGEAGEQGAGFLFIPGGEFNSTERAFFLNSGFRFPLRSYRLTSGFGMRTNPVTGNLRLHQGLDLAAPAGTEVYAAGSGIVTEVGNDPIYGIYVVIKHNDNWASLYGHLQRAGVTLRSTVISGNLIGWVGSTGQSTGPHLHFELRQNGKARDPDKYLFLPGRR
jgi:murein DD-endopeptidase MepM/ murein hydrolase activator NlpD